jgi:DNA-binding response OmpR family regulator
LIPHVLVVDDDTTVSEVMRMALESDGSWRVTCAASADAALPILVHDRPDAAIIDAVMPRVPGLALARAVIEFGVPVLIVSGDPALQHDLAKAGCPFLFKPFRISELVVQTRKLMDDATRRKIDLAASLDRMLKSREELAKVMVRSRQLLEQSRSKRAEQSAVRDGNLLIQQRQAFFDVFLDDAIAATGADMGTLQVLDPAENALRIVASRGFDARFLSFFSLVRANDACACGAAFGQGGRIIVPDVMRSEIFAGNDSEQILRGAGVRAVQSTPFFNRRGGLIGVIATHWASAWVVNDEALARLDTFVYRIAREIGPL